MKILAALLVVSLAAACGGDPPRPSAAERRVMQAYAEKVKELSFEGGRLLQEEIKPRISDLRDGSVTSEQFRREAENWIRLYQDLARRFDDIDRVRRLDATAALYDRALKTYVRAFEEFLAASRHPTQQERNEAITDAVPIAEEADQIFDRAREALNRALNEAGLDPVSL